jgi:transcriptional regulator with XRE-family HTH domain
MTIGERIKKLRKKNGFTQEELGKKVNVSSQVISNWERGYSGLDDDDVSLLSKALKTSSDYLLGHTDNPNPEYKKNDLTEKDEYDIAKRMEKIKEDLKVAEGLSFYGEPMSEEAKESLLEAIEYAERQATRINKKFIPKKYRDKE